MGLGGRREKQLIGADPRNTKWANDTSNPGHRLLSSMGWKADGAATEDEKRSGLMAHASTKRLRVIPVPKAGMEGIGYRPNAAAAASVSLALPGSGGGGTGSRASTASSIFARMGSKAALQFVSAGATKEVINKAKTEGGEFQGLLARLNAASASASPAPSSADEDATPVKGEAAPAVEEGSAGDDDEEEAAPAGETKAERKERRRRKKLGKEEKRAAKRARKAAKNGAPVEVVLLPTPAPSDDGQQAVAVVPAVAESPIVPLRPMAFNPRMASRHRHLASKRMLHASAEAMAEILGIAPTPSPSSSTPASPFFRPSDSGSLPGTVPSSKAASPAPLATPTLPIPASAAASVTKDDDDDAKARKKAEKKAAKLAKGSEKKKRKRDAGDE